MDYGILPPEINSSRMYAGPGSGPMLAAAEAWESLAAELHSAANSYQSVVSGLTAGSWSGPSSASMAAAASSYTAWLTATATQAEESAAQAKSAVAAYQAAFTSTVPPQAIAVNRSQLARLVATNVFGRNTQAIAANEAQYAEMWAQDAAAMYGYAASSASATSLTPFTPPQQNTNPSGSAGQAAAVSQATGTSAGNVQSTVSSIQQAFSGVPNALQSLATAAPAAAAPAQTDPLSTLSNLISIFLDAPSAIATFAADIPFGVVGVTALPLDIIGAGTGLHTDKIVSGWNGEEAWPGTGTQPPTSFPAIITDGATTPTLSAGLAEANTVGALSVPPTWAVATPAVRPIAMTLPTLPTTGAGAVPAAAAAEIAGAGSGSVYAEMAVAGMAGRAIGGTLGGGGGGKGAGAAAGNRGAARPAGAGSTDVPAATDVDGDVAQSTPRAVVTGVAAELREFAKLRDEGILTDQEYTEQKNRLLGR
ncbi:PPE family protein, SVP subgroup [Mycobacterium sp.]|uniref:PPE family protein, SVP subgroup n=1 Tax=Mycobacterium sp. TaxID=1785 RepID=UPI003F9757D4